jgi:imidazoleglycerol phosphate dehydratase HisB
MNAFEKTSKVGRDLFEINAETLRKITELSAENFKKYLELNQDFLQKLPEVRELGAFVELQRDYGQNLWHGIQEDVKARGEILRTAVEQTGAVIRGVLSGEEKVEEAAAA